MTFMPSPLPLPKFTPHRHADGSESRFLLHFLAELSEMDEGATFFVSYFFHRYANPSVSSVVFVTKKCQQASFDNDSNFQVWLHSLTLRDYFCQLSPTPYIPPSSMYAYDDAHFTVMDTFSSALRDLLPTSLSVADYLNQHTKRNLQKLLDMEKHVPTSAPPTPL
jgi:hypothetical protein